MNGGLSERAARRSIVRMRTIDRRRPRTAGRVAVNQANRRGAPCIRDVSIRLIHRRVVGCRPVCTFRRKTCSAVSDGTKRYEANGQKWDWGSRGREFESPQPDEIGARQRHFRTGELPSDGSGGPNLLHRTCDRPHRIRSRLEWASPDPGAVVSSSPVGRRGRVAPVPAFQGIHREATGTEINRRRPMTGRERGGERSAAIKQAMRAARRLPRPAGVSRTRWESTKTILVFLAGCVPDVSPGQQTIAAKTDIPLRTVQRCLALAEDHGLIERQWRDGRRWASHRSRLLFWAGHTGVSRADTRVTADDAATSDAKPPAGAGSPGGRSPQAARSSGDKANRFPGLCVVRQRPLGAGEGRLNEGLTGAWAPVHHDCHGQRRLRRSPSTRSRSGRRRATTATTTPPTADHVRRPTCTPKPRPSSAPRTRPTPDQGQVPGLPVPPPWRPTATGPPARELLAGRGEVAHRRQEVAVGSCQRVRWRGAVVGPPDWRVAGGATAASGTPWSSWVDMSHDYVHCHPRARPARRPPRRCHA